MVIIGIDEKRELQHQKDLERLKKLRPIDDDFMRGMLQGQMPLAQFILRIVTSMPDLTLTKFETQADLKRVTGARNILLDAYGTDTQGKKYDLEVQRADAGARPHRARYHSSVMDVENLDAGQDFEELPDTYTIFITEKDFFGKKEPFYLIQNMNVTTGEPFGDGAYILYINGEYRGDDPIGRLMHDFNCSDPDGMNYSEMAERTRYLKENSEGVKTMCKLMEEMRKESYNEGRYDACNDIALTLLHEKAPIEMIIKATKLTMEQVQALIRKNNIVM